MADGISLGVDFGTSNTVAALRLPGREARPLLFDGSPLLPSAVCADAGGHLLVGRDALHAATGDPASFEPHPKRCVDDETVLLGEREFPVVDLIGAVLHRVATEAARAAGAPPAEVVLTCPAAWGTARRNTLLAAAAGSLPDARLVAEPIAAAHHFVALGADLPVRRVAVIYDFGAGTFDASVIRHTGTGFEVLATEGLPDCGGLDVDAAIVGQLGAALGGHAEWARLTAPESATDRRASRHLWDNVRTAKEMLARAASTLVHVPLLGVDVPLGREQLDEAAAPILARTVDAVRAALIVAGVEPAAIYLAGGSSRMPAVTTVLHRAFGIEPVMADQPELAVAEGSIHVPPPVALPADPSWPDPDEPLEPLVPAPASGSAAPAWRRLAGTRRRRLVAAASAAVLAAAILGTVVAQARRPDGQRPDASGTPDATGRAVAASTPTPSPTPSYPPGIDACLVGSWTVVAGARELEIDGVRQMMSGGQGTVNTFQPDGTVTVVYQNVMYAVTVRGVRWDESFTGTATGRYTTGNGRVLYSNWVVNGTWYINRNGRRNNSGQLSMSVEPDNYVCNGDSLTFATNQNSQQLTRVKA